MLPARRKPALLQPAKSLRRQQQEMCRRQGQKSAERIQALQLVSRQHQAQKAGALELRVQGSLLLLLPLPGRHYVVHQRYQHLF